MNSLSDLVRNSLIHVEEFSVFSSGSLTAAAEPAERFTKPVPQTGPNAKA
jgi:hypothetical protein